MLNLRNKNFIKYFKVSLIFVFQERVVSEISNAISHDKLLIVNATTRVQNLQEVWSGLNEAIEKKNLQISKIENEMIKRNALIEKKQGKVDQLKKKIALIISKEGVDFHH